MDNLDTFMDQATISFLGLFNLLESDGKLKKFITLLSLISLVSGIFPFFCGTKYIQSKNRENIPALVIQSITLGIKASSLWKTFIEMSQFETHMEKFKVNFKNTSSTDNSTNFISAIGDTAMEIFSQKNVYFPLLAAGFSFIILQVIASFHPLNEGHGELKNPFATTIWYLIPFLVLFLSESVTIELFKANVLSNSYLRTVIFRYIARGLSMGYGLCAIMGLSELYGFIGSGLYGLFLPIASSFAHIMREYVLKDLSKKEQMEDPMYQIMKGIRFGATLYIVTNYILPEIFSQLDHFYICLFAIYVGFSITKEYLDIDRPAIDILSIKSSK